MLRNADGDFRRLIDMKSGTGEREIYSDPDIYKLEQERIFARAWNFMCHESQIPNPGDYFLNYIGEESVIATRDREGKLQVFLNSCRHRGNAVCRAESGNARSFVCTYHGWTYDLEGNLTGVPGYREFYKKDLDRKAWGLIKAGKVQSYRGLVFATMDAEAPDLEEYLGDVGRTGLDSLMDLGDLSIVEGVQKFRFRSNWKLAVDNVCDWYHATMTHASVWSSDYLKFQPTFLMDQRALLGEYGHALAGPRARNPVRVGAVQGSVVHGGEAREPGGYSNIFPNLFVMWTTNQLGLRLPRGPDTTELWWFTFADKNATPEERERAIFPALHQLGPAGMIEMDDIENWASGTEGTKGPIARRHPFNFAMNLGRGELVESAAGRAPHIDGQVNEHGQLWTIRSWAEWMEAADWPALRDNLIPPRAGEVV
jgi:phenylpropionate dioxygenase-like ring-hydroxylating dioxygenase large terminal subunit